MQDAETPLCRVWQVFEPAFASGCLLAVSTPSRRVTQPLQSTAPGTQVLAQNVVPYHGHSRVLKIVYHITEILANSLFSRGEFQFRGDMNMA